MNNKHAIEEKGKYFLLYGTFILIMINMILVGGQL